MKRCPWAGDDPLMVAYHDQEWGRPLHDDRGLYEFLVLEGAQAGLSWRTILHKREGYRRAFKDFDPRRVARIRPATLEKLRHDPSIVRNRAKIASAVNNARRFLEVQEEFGSFDAYVWRFVDGQPRRSRFRRASDVPQRTAQSDGLSRELRKRGFSFVGSTICYAFMQATGLVDDHLAGCRGAKEFALRSRRQV